MACKDQADAFPTPPKIQRCTPTSDFVDFRHFRPFETGNWMKLGSLGYMKWCRDTKDVVGLRLLILFFACQCSPSSFMYCIFVDICWTLTTSHELCRSQCTFLHDSYPWGFKKPCRTGGLHMWRKVFVSGSTWTWQVPHWSFTLSVYDQDLWVILLPRGVRLKKGNMWNRSLWYYEVDDDADTWQWWFNNCLEWQFLHAQE